MSGLASLIAKSLSKEASKAVTKQAPEAARVAPRQLEMPLGTSQATPIVQEQRLLKDQYQESLDKLGDATSIAPTPPRMFGDPKYSFLNPILEQTGRKTEDVIAEGVGEYSDVAGKRFITNKRVSNSQINPYNGPGPKFKGTLSEDDITEEQVKNLAKELRSEDVGLLKTNLLKKDKFTVVDDKTGGQLESIGKDGDSYGIVTVAVSGVKNAPQYKKNRGMESDHIYGLHLNIEGDAALLTHKVKDARASAKKGKTVYQQPSLKPTMVGDMKGRNVIGTIKVAGRKEHPLYDVIDIDAATFSDYGFNAGGLLNNNLVEFDASIFEEDTINMNAGGLSMDKQMELFEDGGNVDPVSGNDIPLGSTAAEVRDDQPAMLSEGEMVIPADVVRYFGVEHFMSLRDQAKMGYKKMEAMGQFGTEEGQTLPDDTIFNAGGSPFTIEDIEVIEEEEEPVKAAAGAFVSSVTPIDNDETVSADELTTTGQPAAISPQNTQDLIGTNSFAYLRSLMPKNILESATDEEMAAAENYTNNATANITGTPSAAIGGDGAGTGGATVGGGEGPTGTAGPRGGGASNTAASQPGTGSVAEMAMYPTDANLQGLKDFGALPNSAFGRAALSAMGFLTSAALNPGQYAPVVGQVQSLAGRLEKGLMGTSNISQGFQDLKTIPMVQANQANRAVISYENTFKNLSPQEKADINSIALAKQYVDSQGYAITDPNVTVSVTDRGQTVVSFGKGALAANYDPVTGDIIGDKATPIEEARKNAAANTIAVGNENVSKAMGFEPEYSEEETEAAGGTRTGPETFLDKEGKPTTPPGTTPVASPPGFDFADDVGGPIGGTGTGSRNSISDAISAGRGMGSVAESESEANVSGNVDTSSQVDSFSEMSGDTNSQVDSFSDMGGGDDGAGDGGGTGGDTGGMDESFSSDYKRGGFVKKRKYKKKKKRRGLAGR